MTATNQNQLGSTLWKIADDLRGAMNVDDLRESAFRPVSIRDALRHELENQSKKNHRP